MTERGRHTAILVLVGMTAGARERCSVCRFLEQQVDRPILVPRLPFSRGLAGCARSLRTFLEAELPPNRHRGVDILAYIGGGAVLREMARTGIPLRIGRIVYDRGPIQEQASARLARLVPAVLLSVFGYRAVLELAEGCLRTLPLPETEEEQGLIIETQPSRLARRLGIGADSLAPQDWAPGGLLPGARSAIRLPISHDRVYDDDTFLGEALAFLETGHFRNEGEPLA